MAMNILHKVKSEQPFPNQLTFHKATSATAEQLNIEHTLFDAKTGN